MIFFVILIVLVCTILGLVILVQNPKGGGLVGNVGGFSNQMMGVKQTTDLLEKGTWVLAIVLGLLCLFSSIFVPHASRQVMEKVNATAPVSQPANPAGTVPLGK